MPETANAATWASMNTNGRSPHGPVLARARGGRHAYAPRERGRADEGEHAIFQATANKPVEFPRLMDRHSKITEAWTIRGLPTTFPSL